MSDGATPGCKRCDRSDCPGRRPIGGRSLRVRGCRDQRDEAFEIRQRRELDRERSHRTRRPHDAVHVESTGYAGGSYNATDRW